MNLKLDNVELEKTEIDEIVTQVTKVVEKAVERAVVKTFKNSVGRKTSSAVCAVPECGRPGVSKDLCQSHYQKRHRLGIEGPPYSDQDLGILKSDARRMQIPDPELDASEDAADQDAQTAAASQEQPSTATA